jgi:hypothetical protein
MRHRFRLKAYLSAGTCAQVSILKFGFPQQYDFPSPNIAMARKLWPMARSLPKLVSVHRNFNASFYP